MTVSLRTQTGFNSTGTRLAACAMLLLWAAGLPGCGVDIPAEESVEHMPSQAAAPPPPAYAGRVSTGRALARELIAEEKLPGLSLAVAVGGEVVWAEGFRWASLEEETPVTPTTRFRVGGLSTLLTVAAAGRLLERGDLDLDAPVQQYVPEFPERDGVTMRRLLSHTAGIRHHKSEDEMMTKMECREDRDRLAVFAQDSPAFTPGDGVGYSAYGVVLAGAAVAAAAGEPYLDVVRNDVLERLSLDDTVPAVFDSTTRDEATYYYPQFMLNPRKGLHDLTPVNLTCILPAGGFLSTPSDMVRLGSAFFTGRLLSPATVRELTAPVTLASGERTQQALGWTVRDLELAGAETTVWSVGLGEAVRRSPLSAKTEGGHVPGSTAALLVVPEHRLAVAVVTNTSGSENVAALTVKLAELFAEPGEER